MLVALTALVVAGCSSGGTPTEPTTSAAETSSPSDPGSPSAGSSGSPGTHPAGWPQVSKVLVFVVENHSFEQMQSDMPFTVSLAEKYAYSDNYQALAHPSLPNYLAIVGGTTSDVADSAPPRVHGRSGITVFGQAIRAGRTARVYAEGMPGRCSLTNGGNGYVVRHNPWTYHRDELALCKKYDVPLRSFARHVRLGRLPSVGMVIPNQCHNGHDCSLRVADRWLQHKIEAVMAGPDWTSGGLAIVVTADEDETGVRLDDPDNRVLTVVAHPLLKGEVVNAPLSHLSLSRALSEMSGAEGLEDAADAPSLWTAFGLAPDWK